MEEMKAQLMTRIESKHLMTYPQCLALVQNLPDSYRVLDIHGIRVGRYDTLYYDNAAFFSYLQHHNRKGNRYKLRLRFYESTGKTYLEIKKKTNKGTSEKNRIQTRQPEGDFLHEQAEFLAWAFPYDYRAFHPVIRTLYDRFTLVSTEFPERITFDIGITFQDGQHLVSYPHIVVGEVKYEKGLYHSDARSAIRAMGVRKRGFSKYCTGIALLNDQLKHNQFKENLLYLNKISASG
jgi:hypothetical protein